MVRWSRTRDKIGLAAFLATASAMEEDNEASKEAGAFSTHYTFLCSRPFSLLHRRSLFCKGEREKGIRARVVFYEYNNFIFARFKPARLHFIKRRSDNHAERTAAIFSNEHSRLLLSSGHLPLPLTPRNWNRVWSSRCRSTLPLDPIDHIYSCANY